MDNCMISTVIKFSCVVSAELVNGLSQFDASKSHTGGETTTTSCGTCVNNSVSGYENISNNLIDAVTCVFSESLNDVINTVEALLPHNVRHEHVSTVLGYSKG